jgi:hypothetical protein
VKHGENFKTPTGYSITLTKNFITPTGYSITLTKNFITPTGYSITLSGNLKTPTGYSITLTGNLKTPTGYSITFSIPFPYHPFHPLSFTRTDRSRQVAQGIEKPSRLPYKKTS